MTYLGLARPGRQILALIAAGCEPRPVELLARALVLSGLGLALAACGAAPAPAPAPTAAPAALGPSPIADDRAFARPNTLVDIGGRKLNLFCAGAGSPTVILEAGLAEDSTAWARAQPSMARFTRVCSYDRAGAYFSDPGPMPRSASAITDDLRALLKEAHIAPPYVLVGHELGGLYMQLFASRFFEDIAGMVLIDPLPEGSAEGHVAERRGGVRQDDFFSACATLARSGALRASVGEREHCQIGPDPQRSRELNEARAERGALEAPWTAALSEVRSFWSGRAAEEVRAASRDLGSLPLIMLVHGKVPSGEVNTARYGFLLAADIETALLSRDSRVLIAPRSGLDILDDDPEMVAHRVRDVVEAARAHAPLR